MSNSVKRGPPPSEERAFIKRRQTRIGYCNIACNIYRTGVVLDTAAMVAAIRSDAGASRRLLLAALRQRFALLVSVPLYQ
jgi:hypothetical protein